eukprot:1159913-Prorocentrum_minimum.AAC.2
MSPASPRLVGRVTRSSFVKWVALRVSGADWVGARAGQLLAATSREALGVVRPAAQASYHTLLSEVAARGWREAGQGSDVVRLEQFVLCGDWRYHLRDAYGHKHSDCTLQIVQPAPEGAESAPHPALVGADGAGARSTGGGAGEEAAEATRWASYQGGWSVGPVPTLPSPPRGKGGLDEQGLNEKVRGDC